ncbi:MAG: UvrD-helicase domain-containing protein [Candidatus Kapaibacteriales bacterium]
MANSLTAEQKQALDLTKHIALNANAGSGKTSVLVERYLKIIDEFIKSKDASSGPKNILAITFTNKAASEMLSRVIAKFHEKYEKLLYIRTTDSSSLISSQRVREIRDRLTSARISTIHSFCLDIIARYPVESGIPINFREISQAERFALIEQAFNAIIDKWLSSESSNGSNKRKLLSEILTQIDIQELREITRLLVSNNHLIQYFNDYYDRDFRDNSKSMFEFINKTYFISGLNFFVFLKDTLENIINDESKLISLSKANYLLNGLKSSSFEVLADDSFWKEIKGAYESFFTKKKQLKKDTEKYLTPDVSNNINNKANISSAFIEFIDDVHSYNLIVNKFFNDKPLFWLEEKYFQLCQNIFHFVLDVYEEFQVLKYEEGLLDFNDMLLFAYKLLRDNPEVVEEILRDIKYILVDEFQDTDDLQYRIVKTLVPNLNPVSLKTNSPNLFVVGDSKQSIYSFRNADVRIFERIKSEISNANKSLGISTSNDGILRLSYTFRLHPEISAFVDLIFSKLMMKNEFTPLTDFHIPYERFIIPIGKFIEYVESTPEETRARNPRIKFLIHLKKEAEAANLDDGEQTDGVDTLTRNVVRHIQHIVGNDDYTIFDKKSKTNRVITYSDIAIISRKIKDLASLITVLSEARIPFIFHGVRNFFATAEIADFIAFLKFLINPNDDVAFAGILRSIFFGFTDEWLLNIATVTDNKDLSFWEKFHILIEKLEANEIEMQNEEEKEDLLRNLKETKNILSELLSRYSSLPLNEVIQRIINQTNWIYKVRQKQNYEQIIANIDELLDYARDFIGHGFRTISDFVEQIEYANQHSIPEGERFGTVAINAIRLLTIHSSKGLEFPVVYVYQIDSKAKSNQNFFLSKEFGFAFPMKIYSQDRKFSVKTLQYYIAKYHATAEIDAEEIRLLYVALTRASEYLIITGNALAKDVLDNFDIEKRTKRKTSDEMEVPRSTDNDKIPPRFRFYGWLNQIMNIVNPDVDLSFNVQIPITSNIQIGDEETNNLSIQDLNFYLDWIVEPNLFQISQQVQIDEFINKPSPNFLLFDKINLPSSGILISPTRILTYKQDSRLYLMRYFLGLSDELNRLEKFVFAENYETTDHIILSSILGNAVHYCLQNLELWHSKAKFDYSKLQALVSDYLFVNERLKETEIKQNIIDQCLSVVQTSLFKNHVELILASPKEFEVTMPFSNNFLFGKIDLLFTKPNQEHEIWDWKTNNVQNKEKMIEVAISYKFQMVTYAFLLSKCFPEQTEWIARLLFTQLAKNSSQDEDWTYVFKWTKDELENFSDQIDDIQKKFINLIF